MSKSVVAILSVFALLGVAAGLGYHHLCSQFMAPSESSAEAASVPEVTEIPIPAEVAAPPPPPAAATIAAEGSIGKSSVADRPLAKPAAATASVAGQATVAEKVVHFYFDGALQAEGVPIPWQLRSIVGSMQIDLVDDPKDAAHKAIHLRCNQSHYVLYNATRIDPSEYPILTWKWMVKSLPENGDVRVHNPIPIIGENRNDSAVRVMVGFEGDNVLCYLWDSNAPVGTEEREPSPVATIRSQVVDSGSTHLNEWISHRVNIVDDYRRRYGKGPGNVVGIAIETNSNHTSAVGDAFVADITARQH